LRATPEHVVHFPRPEVDMPGTAQPGGHPAEQFIGERLPGERDVIRAQPGVQAAHAAGDIETDAAGRDDPALLGIEGRHAADRETVTPVRVRHRIGMIDDARQGRHVSHLLVNLVVHGFDQRTIGVNDRGHPHPALCRDFPGVCVTLGKQAEFHALISGRPRRR
jgi:hypothetical protein